MYITPVKMYTFWMSYARVGFSFAYNKNFKPL